MLTDAGLTDHATQSSTVWHPVRFSHRNTTPSNASSSATISRSGGNMRRSSVGAANVSDGLKTDRFEYENCRSGSLSCYL